MDDFDKIAHREPAGPAQNQHADHGKGEIDLERRVAVQRLVKLTAAAGPMVTLLFESKKARASASGEF